MKKLILLATISLSCHGFATTGGGEVGNANVPTTFRNMDVEFPATLGEAQLLSACFKNVNEKINGLQDKSIQIDSELYRARTGLTKMDRSTYFRKESEYLDIQTQLATHNMAWKAVKNERVSGYFNSLQRYCSQYGQTLLQQVD